MHVTKYTKGTLGHMLGHYDRTKDGLGENVVAEHKKTRPAKCQIDKAGGFSYNGFSGSDCRPYHEYMRDKLTYSP